MSGPTRQPGEKGWAHPDTQIGQSSHTPPLTVYEYHDFSPKDGNRKRCARCNRKRKNWIHYH